MKKLLFFLFLLTGCDQSSEMSIADPTINKVFVDSEANGLFAGSPVKLWVELKDLPTSDGWSYDFVLNGDVVETIPAKSTNGWITTFHSFTPATSGNYTYEGVLRSGSLSYSEDVVFEVKSP